MSLPICLLCCFGGMSSNDSPLRVPACIDLFCFCDWRQRKKPESGSIRRAFRQSDSHGLGSSMAEPASPGAIAGSRPSSQPIMSQSLPKEVPDKCSISGHGSLNSISRHSSLKNRIDSPQIRKTVTAGRSKSFNNHRPMDPEVIAQVRSALPWRALLE